MYIYIYIYIYKKYRSKDEGVGAKHQGSEHSTGSCESGRRWQLKGQLKEKRSRAWLHCCSAEEQTERQGCSTPPRALHWGRNIPHSSRRRGSKHASSISTWTEEEEPVSLENGCVVVSRRHRGASLGAAVWGSRGVA